jgi:uncharacterized protein YecE (DUF72 family)
MTKLVTNFFSGLSGLALPIAKYQFPPEHEKSSRLTYYASFFNSIEVNSSFYKIPKNTTVARWSSSVGDHFRFTFKLFKEITHVKNLNFDNSLVQDFVTTIEHVGVKQGCILVQFPPGLGSENIEKLDDLLGFIKSANDKGRWTVAVEFRNKGWYNADVFNLLENYKVALVLHDIPLSATPFTRTSPDVLYVRFHGPTGNYRGDYSEAFLSEYAGYIREWLQEGKTCYVYFNNTMGPAFNNLMKFNTLVSL